MLMSGLESIKKLLRCWLCSIPFFVVLGLGLGVALAIPLIPKPNIAMITISGPIWEQAYADEILNMLRYARD
jgi:hypothetical protein